MKFKFSIIVPVYNVAPWLRECLDSVLAQTYEGWECICVDDGSTDGSGKILDEYSARDSRFRIVHQQNGGVSAARNAAIGIVNGEWVLMPDGDDTWRPDLLVKLFNEIKKQSDCDAVRFRIVKVDDKDEPLEELGGNNVSPTIMAGDEILLNGGGGYSKFIWNSSDKIYRCSVIEKNPLRYAVGMKHTEDALFSQAFLACAGKVVLRSDIHVYRYYIRKGSAIHVEETELPDRPFLMFETLYAHWLKLKTHGLRLSLYYVAVAMLSLGKGDGCVPSMRRKGIECLLLSEMFDKYVLHFFVRHGRLKVNLFSVAYWAAPSFLRRKLLEVI